MNPQSDPLAALHPLREPAAIALWPPAPGWWLLALLLMVLLIAAALWLRRRHQLGAYRRQGLQQLSLIRARWQTSDDEKRYVAEVNALLKAVAMRALPEPTVASASGQEWLALLDAHAPKDWTAPKLLATGPYSPAPDTGAETLYDMSARWIREHRAES